MVLVELIKGDFHRARNINIHEMFSCCWIKNRVSLPRETSVAKSLDFSRLIRLAPQSSNLLNPEIAASPLLQEENPSDYGRDGGAVGGDNNIGVARGHLAAADNLQRGSLETILVFGMICIAIVASMASFIWFIRSYRTAGATLGGQSTEDNESFETPYDSHSSQDNSSEFEVELDFEFSDDNNDSVTHQSSPSSPSSSNPPSLKSTSSSSFAWTLLSLSHTHT